MFPSHRFARAVVINALSTLVFMRPSALNTRLSAINQLPSRPLTRPVIVNLLPKLTFTHPSLLNARLSTLNLRL